MANKCMKKKPLLAIRAMKVKSKMRDYIIPVRRAMTKETNNPSGVGKYTTKESPHRFLVEMQISTTNVENYTEVP